ncbi:MAG: hypothetical protein ACYTEG_05360 [Planctomycetota bacterium]
MDEQVQSLHEEWQEQRARQDAEGYARLKRDRRNAVIAGAMVGFLSTLATVQFTRQALFWHSYLLETLLGALAGFILVRRGADPLLGVLCFGGAYLLAWLIRAIGMDPSVLFHHGDIRGAAMIQGNVLSLCLSVSCGAALGHVMSNR